MCTSEDQNSCSAMLETNLRLSQYGLSDSLDSVIDCCRSDGCDGSTASLEGPKINKAWPIRDRVHRGSASNCLDSEGKRTENRIQVCFSREQPMLWMYRISIHVLCSDLICSIPKALLSVLARSCCSAKVKTTCRCQRVLNNVMGTRNLKVARMAFVLH